MPICYEIYAALICNNMIVEALFVAEGDYLFKKTWLLT